MSWGVLPVLTPIYNSTDKMFEIANNLVKGLNIATPGNTMVITCGAPKQPGCTNLIKIDVVK